MKVLVCGKGGCGKSTVSVLLAKSLTRLGFSVLLVDADESNTGLHRLLGASAAECLMDGLGGRQGVREKMNAEKQALNAIPIFNTKIKIQDLPGSCVSQADGIRLLSIGKIRNFGEGCACMMGALAKRVLQNLDVRPDEAVVVDMEAGVEHFGRGVEAGCDLVVCVVDPSYESLLLANRMLEMAGAAGVPAGLAFNRADEKTLPLMSARAPGESVLGHVPRMEELFTAGLEGRPAGAPPPEMEGLARAVTLKAGVRPPSAVRRMNPAEVFLRCHP
jgi:CO dehydrogenase maturation factor